MGVCARVVVRQMGSQRRRIGDVPRLLSVDPAAARWAGARRAEIVSPVTTRAAYNVDLLLLQYFYQARCRSSQRIRIRSHSRGRNALARARHRALGTDRFANHRIDVYFRHELRARVHWPPSHRSYWSRASNIATRPAFLSNRRCHRIDWNFVDDYAHDCFHKRSCNRQLAIANGRRVGPVAPELVLAFASALQNANQLDYLRRDGDARDCYRPPARCGHPGSVSTY